MALRVCSCEARPEGVDGLILMAESLCRADPGISLHLTVPNGPDSVREWAAGRPEVELSTEQPKGVSGFDVKPRLLLQALDAGYSEALWIDSDIIVTRSVRQVLSEFPADALLVAEEWDGLDGAAVAHLWKVPPVRLVAPANTCVVRATAAHRRLLERWLEEMQDPEYREIQKLPFDKRPWRLIGDQSLLSALLGGPEFRDTAVDYIRMGRHIAQCAGSSGYKPGDRVRDLFRGLPAMIHCIGRKPWGTDALSQGFMLDLAMDVSPYVLAARRAAREAGMAPGWLEPRTGVGAMLRRVTGGHPGIAGLPLAVAHSFKKPAPPTNEVG